MAAAGSIETQLAEALARIKALEKDNTYKDKVIARQDKNIHSLLRYQRSDWGWWQKEADALKKEIQQLKDENVALEKKNKEKDETIEWLEGEAKECEKELEEWRQAQREANETHKKFMSTRS